MLEVSQRLTRWVFDDIHWVMVGVVLALAIELVLEDLRRADTGDHMPPDGILIDAGDKRQICLFGRPDTIGFRLAVLEFGYVGLGAKASAGQVESHLVSELAVIIRNAGDRL